MTNLISEHCVIGEVISIVVDSLIKEDFLEDNDNRSCVAQSYIAEPTNLKMLNKSFSLKGLPQSGK